VVVRAVEAGFEVAILGFPSTEPLETSPDSEEGINSTADALNSFLEEKSISTTPGSSIFQ
jgi:hypothetical protein